MRALLAAVLLAAAGGCQGGPAPAPPPPATTRTVRPLGGPWRFLPGGTLAGAEAPRLDDSTWAMVDVPHTWSVAGPRPHRAWYRTRFELAPSELDGAHTLLFEGVGVLARVHLNGVRLGSHLGAYTSFALDASGAVRAGENVLAVLVSNAPEDTANSLPSGAHRRQLYSVDGGITRKVWLLRTHRCHLDPLPDATTGVAVQAEGVSAAGATLTLRARLRNASSRPRTLRVRHLLLDPEGAEVLRLEGGAEVGAGAAEEVSLAGTVPSPRLWGPGHPHLYTVRSEVLADGAVTDHVEQRTGFRDFRLLKDRFVLNGEPLLLRGVGKHQEAEGRGAAVTDEDIRRDFDALQDLGVNLVRLAHYPHSDLAYQLADERGILVWAENGHSNPWKSREDGDRITREMVRQLRHHPSIVFWSVGNETAWYQVARYAEVARGEDPTRLVTYAANVDPRRKQGSGLDFWARNLYLGWYSGDPWDFERAVQWRYISETGGGAVVASHTDYADARHEVDRFEPEEWRQVLAEAQGQIVFRDRAARIPLYSVWILRDFRVDKYKGTNTKGLLTGGGLPKDAYHLYRAWLRPSEPTVHITSKTYFLRRGRADNGVKVYSNLPELRLSVNGEDLGPRRNGEHRHANGRRVENVFHWPARLHQGRNEVVATDGRGHEDRAVVTFAGRGGLPPSPGPEPLVRRLVSANPRNPAWWIDQPARSQWPFYWETDGTADNTFGVLPEAVRGAGWIATARLSKPGMSTELRFEVAADAEVLVMCGEGAGRALARAGFADTGRTGLWRDNLMRLSPWRLFSRGARAGAAVTVPATAADAVVLVRRAEAR